MPRSAACKKNATAAMAAAILLFFSASCKTTRFIIPGEKKVAVDNIFVEYYNLGEEYFKLKNYTKAAEYYIKASSNKDIHNAACFKAARSYALAKDWSKATGIYEEMILHLGFPSFLLLDCCSRIYIPEPEKAAARIRTDSFFTTLEKSRYRELKQRIIRVPGKTAEEVTPDLLKTGPAFGKLGKTVRALAGERNIK